MTSKQGHHSVVGNSESSCGLKLYDSARFVVFLGNAAEQKRLHGLARFERDDESLVLGMLMREKPEIALHYPQGGPPICFAVPEHAAGQLIARLHIHKRIDPGVLDAIRRNLPLDRQLTARVMIRNARFDCRGGRAAFLEAFMGAMPAMTQDLFGHLAFVLDFLEACPDGTDLREALAQRKQLHRKNIAKAEQFERQRRNRNVETMIMQGIRIPHFDPREDMRKIALIDTVAIALYGKIL